MANVYSFSSDRIYVYLFLIDKSGSMGYDEENMRAGLRAYKKSFENFPEANSIAISRSTFNETVDLQCFRALDEMDTENYRANGGTAIYYAIIEGANHLKRYMQEIAEILAIKPIGTLVVLSDGVSEGDRATRSEAKEAIDNLNYMGVNTVFVAFGEALRSNFGDALGFSSTIDVRNRESLVTFMGERLSESCKQQSKSLKALGANFFSKATNSSSAGYSKTTAQALDDEDWFDVL